MSESDDENFAIFGSALEPLDEECLPRKKPVTIEDQYALDAQGRRRFHGAFTGGFSAGYFNTVDTRDGWRPQQFKSSRSSKAGSVSQRPEDFMDEEDTGEFGIAPTAIIANSDFTDHGRRGTKRERHRRDETGPIPGVPVLRDLLKPAKDTVGVKLLKKMGWRPGQGIGPRATKREKAKTRQRNERIKIYGCSLPGDNAKVGEVDSDASDDNNEGVLFAPDDYEPFVCNPKDNYFGIGYTGLDRRPILSGHVDLFQAPVSFDLQEKNKKLSIRGQAFGVGAFEADDEDIYHTDDMSRYDFALGPEKKAPKSRWSEKKNKSEDASEKSLEGFVEATKNLERKRVFRAPELPSDFQPRHVIRKSRFYPPIEPQVSFDDWRKRESSRTALSATDRARILGEPSVVRDSSKDEDLGRKNEGRIDEKTTSVACKIIARTLNLEGRERVDERSTPCSRGTAGGSATWLDKLSTKSFVSGGVENKTSDAAGNLKSLANFKTRTSENPSSKLFAIDPEKQTRFDRYLELTRRGESVDKLETLQPLSMTEWEREREKDEFESAARIFDKPEVSIEETTVAREDDKLPTDGTMSGRFVSGPSAAPSRSEKIDEPTKKPPEIKLEVKPTRTREIWQPASIVCKRFNIPEPQTGCSKMEKPTRVKQFSVFDFLDFNGGNDKTDGATDGAADSKDSQPETPRDARPSVPSTNVDASVIEASSSRSTLKMRSFEASYEKVFGRVAPITTTNATTSATTADHGESDNHADSKKERENSIARMEDATNETKSGFVEKKDLFKAIFLSSSEDSDSEKEEEEEDDSEAVKSLLIGKTPGELNLQRNTSPPRGIFAKLDLDSLAKPGKSSNPTGSETSMETKGNSDDAGRNTAGVDEDDEAKDGERGISARSLDEQLLPDMYGPALPKTLTRSSENTTKNETSLSTDSEPQRPVVFKSVVVARNDADAGRARGKWVERDRSKKSKKDKHKHKHKSKERSRHKHKSKKEKR